jgi:hypothetical protein
VDEQVSGGCFERKLAQGFWPGPLVRTSGMARPGASAERLIDNAFDGARASAAFGAAAEAAVDLLWIARKVFRGIDGGADIVVAKDVTRTNNHDSGKAPRCAGPSILKTAPGSKRKNPVFKQFQTDAEHTLE